MKIKGKFNSWYELDLDSEKHMINVLCSKDKEDRTWYIPLEDMEKILQIFEIYQRKEMLERGFNKLTKGN